MKSWFFEKISKTDKPSASQTHQEKERTQIKSERDERDVVTDTTETQRVREGCKQLCASKLEHLEEMGKFL